MRRLSNYLKKHRKRLGLTQDDVAFLLGAVTGTKVSRYEQFARVPLLETALAFEAIFEIPVRELFAGLYEAAEDKVLTRAHTLVRKKQEFSGPGANRRKQSVDKLAKRKIT